jgi:hypothetical protein
MVMAVMLSLISSVVWNDFIEESLPNFLSEDALALSRCDDFLEVGQVQHSAMIFVKEVKSLVQLLL